MNLRIVTAAAIAATMAFRSFAGDPPAGQGYVLLGSDRNSPTPCTDGNADSLAISEAKVGSTVWSAVGVSGVYGWGFFGSSMTAPRDQYDTFYGDFPTMCRWYSFDAGPSQSAADRVKYCPPNPNYDYWIGGTTLTTPNDNSVESHYGKDYVYRFNGRSLTIDGEIGHCSKASSVCDFGTNVTLKGGGYAFPALGNNVKPVVRMKAKVEGQFRFRASSGMLNGARCYLDVSLSGPAGTQVIFTQDKQWCATWYWCGDCADYKGKLLVSGNTATSAQYTTLAISNVVCGGEVEVEACQRLQTYGDRAYVEKASIADGAGLDVTGSHVTRVGTLSLCGQLSFLAPAGRLVVTKSFSISRQTPILLAKDVSGEILTVPSDSTFTADDFVLAVARSGGAVTTVTADFRDNGDGSKTLVVSNPLAVADGTLAVTGSALIGTADERVRVNVAPGAALTLSGNGGTRMPVNSEGGTVTLARVLEDWSTVPSLWLDASADATVSNVVIVYENSYNAYTEANPLKTGETYCDAAGNPFVKGWFDCRSTQRTLKLWNARYDSLFNGNHNVMAGTHPRRVLAGFNGKDYISCDRPTPNVRLVYADGTTVASAGPNPANLSRIYFTGFGSAPGVENDRPQSPRYAFFVFGSQNGGGGSLLGGNANFVRGGTANAHKAGDAIFASNVKNAQVWLDGTEVDPTKTGFSGGWQVVTVDYRDNGNQFIGLGFGSGNGTDHGGQAYAEVVLVNEALSERQRQTIEICLAEKWGLQAQYRYPAWAKEPFATVYGTGTVNLETNARLGGAFRGTIDLKGRSLAIDGTALPPTEAAIDTTGLEGWYDPDQEGKAHTSDVAALFTLKAGGTTRQEKAPNPRMITLADKIRAPKAGDAHLYGQPQRAPWLNAAKRGFGPVRKWMDFSNQMEPLDASLYTGVNNGNVLRFSRFTAGLDSDAATYQQPMQTLFFVQDSVHGGGHPFADGANVNSPVLYRSRTNAVAAVGKPIYPAGSNAILTKGLTCLDGREVDGLVESFGARPEVVTVVPTNTFGLVALGQLGNSENIKGGTTELLGELMIYNRRLGAAERKVVEAYLSHKWLGIEGAGYSELTGATVTGAGRVTAAFAALLPQFAAGFTGVVSVPLADGLSFALETAGSTTAVVGARDLGGGTLEATGEVTVRVTQVGARPKAGVYRLLGWATRPAATWKLQLDGWTRDVCALRAEDDGLYLDLGRIGMAILVR